MRERYLRDDVPCGIANCSLCSISPSLVSTGNDSTNQYYTSPPPAPVLPASGAFGHSLFPSGHLILPDTNVVLGQMDLLESSLLDAPIILLQTVMEEVRHRSLPLYSRLKALIKADDKKVFVFYNEFCR